MYPISKRLRRWLALGPLLSAGVLNGWAGFGFADQVPSEAAGSTAPAPGGCAKCGKKHWFFGRRRDSTAPGGTCFPRIDNCASIYRGAIPQPYGWFAHKWQNAQCSKAEADDFVVYKHEWFKGGTELGPYGRYHLMQMLKRLPGVPFPVLLEVERQDPARNEMRRLSIINCLTQAGVPDPETRVVLGYPEAGGLFGDESQRIYRMMIALQAGMFGGMGFGGGGFTGLNSIPGGGTMGGFGGPAVAIPQNLP